MTAAERQKFWNEWLSQTDNKIFRQQIKIALDAWDMLVERGDKIGVEVGKFVDYFGKTAWDLTPIAAKDRLYDSIMSELQKIDKVLSGQDGFAANIGGEVLDQINVIGERLGIPLTEYAPRSTMLKAFEHDFEHLTDAIWTGVKSDVATACRTAWLNGDTSVLQDNVRDILGLPVDLRPTLVEAMKDTHGTPTERWQVIGEKYKALLKKEYPDSAQEIGRGAFYKVERLLRSEATKIYDELNNNWMQSLGEVVIGEEFVNEETACELCQDLAGIYPVGEAPALVEDTHPNCNCRITPVFRGYEISQDEFKGSKEQFDALEKFDA